MATPERYPINYLRREETQHLNGRHATTVIPNVRGVSESLRRVLTALEILVCFRQASSLRQILSRHKEPVPILEQSAVVRKIPCFICLASYIGQTGRTHQQRLEEHKRTVRQVDFNMSALAEHAWTNSLPVDWSNVGVFHKPRDVTTRLIEESITIRKATHTLNRDTGILQLTNNP